MFWYRKNPSFSCVYADIAYAEIGVLYRRSKPCGRGKIRTDVQNTHSGLESAFSTNF